MLPEYEVMAITSDGVFRALAVTPDVVVVTEDNLLGVLDVLYLEPARKEPQTPEVLASHLCSWIYENARGLTILNVRLEARP